MENFKKIFIGDAWPYVNGDPHVGHFAGHLIPADIFARFNRLRGNDVLMVSGSDCYGTPITVEADKRKMSPMELVNQYHPKILNLLTDARISYDLYTKTVTTNHSQVVQQLFLDLLSNGYIYKDYQLQYFSSRDNKFLPDRWVEGTCKYCSFQKARSDQCDNCGRVLSPGDLINPYSNLTDAPVEFKQTQHYFLDLPKLQPMVEKYVESKKGVWKDWVYAETLGWLQTGLQARAITRDLDWGVELPIDQIPGSMRLKSFENKRIYVWMDAVTGYLSAAIEWSKLAGNEKWKEFWFDPQTEGFYFMGKDNLFFHTLLWPAQLIGASNAQQKYNLPHNVSVNAYLNLEGKKNSKSRKWYIDSIYLFSKYGSDRSRFYFGTTLPETKDSDFTWIDFQTTINSELVGNLGNFIHRTLTFINSKFDGTILNSEIDPEVQQKIENAFAITEKKIEQTKFVDALNEVMKLSKFGNKYFDENKPWLLAKTDQVKAQNVLFNCVNIINNLKMLISPWMPDAANRLNDLLNINEKITDEININNWKYKLLTNIHVNTQIIPLFEKVTDEDIEIEKNKLIESQENK